MFSMTLERLLGDWETMGYFAELDENNTVMRVISISNSVLREPDISFPDTEPIGQDYIANGLKLPGMWLQTSFNGNFRGRYAGINYTYDPQLDQFIAPQPFPSWVLDQNGDWQAPVQKPNDGNRYFWDEISLSWVAVGM